MTNLELANLRRARTRVHHQINLLEPLLAGYRAKLADLEARIHSKLVRGTFSVTFFLACLAVLGIAALALADL